MPGALRFVDETLRDGPQSLWASRLRTETMLTVGPLLDRAGFHEIVVGSAALFEAAVKYLHEDPWERLRLVRTAMPASTLRFLIRGRNLMGWRRYPNDVVEMMVHCLRRAGMDSVMVFDGLNDIRNIEWYFHAARESGLRCVGIVCFTESPVHTDDYFVDKARQFVKLGVDAIVLYDASGVLTPARTKALVPAMRAAIEHRAELEVTVHAATGQGLDCLLAAIRAGTDIVFTAATAVAYGDSIPATVDVVRAAARMGVSTALDMARVRQADDYMAWVAHEQDKPRGRRNEFDAGEYARYVSHQIPGGMMSNLVRQLSDLGLGHRLPDILEEAAAVRRELGYPVMVTPMSQLVGVQATLNVVEGERYRTVPHELKMYARGAYGQPAAPLDGNALDRILGPGDSPIDPTEGFLEPALRAVAESDGPFDSDEELLMSVFYSRETVTEYRAKRRAVVPAAPARPLNALIRELATRPHLESVHIAKGPLNVTWEARG
jgi:oxaloacetate decarboxylase (Na+ extruding) subunit alpha